MPFELPVALVAFVERFRLLTLAKSTIYAIGFLGVFFVVIAFLEWREGADPKRYASRHFLNDVVYSLFYRGGIYGVFIAAAVTNALESNLAFMRVDLLSNLPFPAAVVLFWIISDFIGYWNHRLQHHSRFLWAFHSVHHAQEHLSFLSSYRLHPIEQLISNVVMVVPLLILGVPTTSWLPLVVAMSALEFVQHAELNWRFGRWYPVFVSPTFHAFHHSEDPSHYDRNFGKIMSTWDFMFGTAVKEGERPSRFGVRGLAIPERLSAQFAAPFRILSGSRALAPQSAFTVEPPVPLSQHPPHTEPAAGVEVS